MAILIQENFEGDGIPNWWNIESPGTDENFDYATSPLVDNKSLYLSSETYEGLAATLPTFEEKSYIEIGFVYKFISNGSNSFFRTMHCYDDNDNECFELQINESYGAFNAYVNNNTSGGLSSQNSVLAGQTYAVKIVIQQNESDPASAYAQVSFSEFGTDLPSTPQLTANGSASYSSNNISKIVFKSNQYAEAVLIDQIIVGDEVGDVSEDFATLTLSSLNPNSQPAQEAIAMTTTGAQNGTNIYLAVEDTPGAGTYTMVGGQSSHTLTLNNTVIDITNKTSQQFRELLEGEGNQSVDITLELTFNSLASFNQVKTQARDKTQLSYQIAYGDETFTAVLQIASWAETSPDSDKLTASVSYQSSGSFSWA